MVDVGARGVFGSGDAVLWVVKISIFGLSLIRYARPEMTTPILPITTLWTGELVFRSLRWLAV